MGYTRIYPAPLASGLLTPTHYVSPTGTATSRANATSPTDATHQASAANAMLWALPGDVWQFAAGTYSGPGAGDPLNQSTFSAARWLPPFRPTNSGTAGSSVPGVSGPITFQAVPGTVALTLSSGAGPIFGVNGRDYITWYGFSVDEANGVSVPDTGAVTLYCADYCIIDSCVIDGNGIPSTHGAVLSDNHTGVRINGDGTTPARGNIVRNCVIRDCWSNAHNHGVGVQTYYSADTLIEHNEIDGCDTGVAQKADIASTGSGWYRVRYNVITNTWTDALYIASRTLGDTGPYEFYQNLLYHIGNHGVQLGNGGATASRYVSIVNNTFALVASAGIYMDSGGPADAHITIQNNIFAHPIYCGIYSDNAALAELADRARFVFDYNTWHGISGNFYRLTTSGTFSAWQTNASPQDAHSDTSEPLFTDEVGHDYTLQAGSPARLTGVDVLNLLGGGTSAAIDRGCYVAGATIGRTS